MLSLEADDFDLDDFFAGLIIEDTDFSIVPLSFFIK